MDVRARQFEALALPHLDAAYNLARWLLRHDQAAEDVVQEAYLRAFRYFGSFQGSDPKPWLMRIVRNACFAWLDDNRMSLRSVEFDDARDAIEADGFDSPDDPERLLLRKEDCARVDAALGALPPVFREVLVLREFEELSYDAIARVAGIPIGTVMSRLSRGRAMLRAALTEGNAR